MSTLEIDYCICSDCIGAEEPCQMDCERSEACSGCADYFSGEDENRHDTMVALGYA